MAHNIYYMLLLRYYTNPLLTGLNKLPRFCDAYYSYELSVNRSQLTDCSFNFVIVIEYYFLDFFSAKI